MKKCHYCFTEIHERASICPECLNPQTSWGRAKGTVVAGFPIMAAFISFGLAAYEKHQAETARTNLAVTERKLQVEEIRSEVAEEAVVEMSRESNSVGLSRAVREPEIGRDQLQLQLDDLETRFQQASEGQRPNPREIQQLQKEKIRLLQQMPHRTAGRQLGLNRGR